MTPTSVLTFPEVADDSDTARLADRAPSSASTERLGESIAALAARLHAATYELLVLLREFDERAGWNCGFLTCAHWLQWRTGIDLGAAREKVRVAKALPTLPLLSAAMRRGAISYAKVRAITRVATPDNEAALLDLALAGTAAHAERFVRAWRRVDRVAEARHTETRHLRRELAIWVDDDGMVMIRGRLTPEAGAAVQRAIDAAAERLFREGAHAPTGDAMAEEVSPAQRRADALVLVAESALAADIVQGSTGDRYQVVLHADTADLAALLPNGADDAGAPASGSDRTHASVRSDSGEGRSRFDAVVELGDGAVRVSAETSRRLTCDTSIIRMRHDADGGVLDVGRKTRSVPSAIRRALAARDTRCQFPGCAASRCDAHHVVHWVDGGATSLDNLVLLCRRHHRAVHEGGFSVALTADGTATFRRPDGALLHAAPATPIWRGESAGDNDATHGRSSSDALEPLTARLAVVGIVVGPETSPVWDGLRFDLGWAVDVVRGRATNAVGAGVRCGLQ